MSINRNRSEADSVLDSYLSHTSSTWVRSPIAHYSVRSGSGPFCEADAMQTFP
jgi:hypothetical protein